MCSKWFMQIDIWLPGILIYFFVSINILVCQVRSVRSYSLFYYQLNTSLIQKSNKIIWWKGSKNKSWLTLSCICTKCSDVPHSFHCMKGKIWKMHNLLGHMNIGILLGHCEYCTDACTHADDIVMHFISVDCNCSALMNEGQWRHLISLIHHKSCFLTINSFHQL